MEELKTYNDQRINIRIENYTGEEPIEIIYREDKPAEHLKPIAAKMPDPICIEGTIGCVSEWLEKRKEYTYKSSCRLMVNRDKSSIMLIINETDTRVQLTEEDLYCLTLNELSMHLPQSSVTGSLQFAETYKKLHINDDTFWSPSKLSKFLRLNRVIFADKEDGMLLVSALKNVKAKINADYEKKKELHGQISKTEYLSQEVTHNLPESFQVEIAIFKGAPKEKYEIEIDADIVDGDIMVQLLSPAINDDVESARDVLINNELEKIAELCPNLVIIEE